jgi:uroporphyrinogen-III synthase
MPRHPAPPLAGWYVISLRPLGQHAALRRAAAALGARTFALSTLRLRALPAAAPRRRALAGEWLVATSPAAVRFAFAEPVPKAALARPWFAPGAGTAAALLRHGVADVRHARDGGDSDALLALPELQHVAGRRIGLLTAPGGRDLIEPTLAQRGAHVARADLYVREALVPAGARLARLARLPSRTALLVSSAEALEALWTALDAGQRERMRRRLAIASSPRLAARLRALGFVQVRVADGARPVALLAALGRHAGAKSVPVR